MLTTEFEIIGISLFCVKYRCEGGSILVDMLIKKNHTAAIGGAYR